MYCIVLYGTLPLCRNSLLSSSIRMNVDNIKSQMRKGMLEYCVMLMLSKERAFASQIIERMREARLIVVEGTLYPLLTRLKNTGLLTYQWEESTQGPPRKYYELTEEGQRFLSLLSDSWEEISHAVNHIAGNGHPTEK